MTPLYAFISGALCVGSFVAATFFLKFWRRTRDRLFALFGLAFSIMGIERVLHLLVFHFIGEDHVAVFGLRLLAFLLIAFAVVDKNRSDKERG